MKNPRSVGLALILLGTTVLLGNTTEALPPEAFFAGLVFYPIGGYLFFTGSRKAIEKAETRAAKIRKPRLRNETAESYAEAQRRNIEETGSVDAKLRALKEDPNSRLATPSRTPQALELDDELGSGEDLVVTTDVSFPIEVQESDSLADQLMKLQKLRDDGIISEEEMAVAKAKLLG